MKHFLPLKGKICFIYVYVAFDFVSFNDPVKANELLGKGEIQFGRLLF